MKGSRIQLAQHIKAERKETTAEPTYYKIIEAAADGLLKDPPNYDALRPDLAEKQARRVLLAAWILSDQHPLGTTPTITRLQEWEWGEHPLEWLASGLSKDGKLDGDARCEICRLYARTALFDDRLNEWVRLATDAIRYLEVSIGGKSAQTLGHQDRSQHLHETMTILQRMHAQAMLEDGPNDLNPATENRSHLLSVLYQVQIAVMRLRNLRRNRRPTADRLEYFKSFHNGLKWAQRLANEGVVALLPQDQLQMAPAAWAHGLLKLLGHLKNPCAFLAQELDDNRAERVELDQY